MADTSPLNYLVLIQAIETLPKLYRTIVAPSAVVEELVHPDAPEAVRRWAAAKPEWLHLGPAVRVDPALADLGRGEHEAIVLAESAPSEDKFSCSGGSGRTDSSPSHVGQNCAPGKG